MSANTVKATCVIGFSPHHRPRAIHDDRWTPLFRALGFSPPVRASHVETIRRGPNAWKSFVDMSPLGDEFNFCLWPPSDTREQALAAEHDFILNNWVTHAKKSQDQKCCPAP